ncbi:MAG TPA: hypothetical protein VFJ16_27040 [Longimicrobium sp.]|nr:hypothetical protein [Longimicrobium sp.]
MELGNKILTASEDELSMDRLVADAVLEFGDDLRAASEATAKWTCQAATS